MSKMTAKIGGIVIGGGNLIRVQSMTNTDTRNVKKTVAQIKKLEKAGCELVRVSVPDMESAVALKKIKSKINIPLIADIHFDHRLAIEAIKNGADKIRINPGNIGSEEKVKEIIKYAKNAKVPIRIGVNSGSLKKQVNYNLKIKSKNETANYMVASLMEYIEFFEKNDFYDLVLSLKSSEVEECVEAYRLADKLTDYPLHIGITEAGTEKSGVIKSSIGLGILLYDGIGDTIRVSLSADPVEEIYTAYRILDVTGRRKYGVEIISCPTCARTEIDVIKLAAKIEKLTLGISKPLKIAIMGCVVNGPGEAKNADLGISGSKNFGVIFKNGQIIKKVPKQKVIKEFEKELHKLLKGDRK